MMELKDLQKRSEVVWVEAKPVMENWRNRLSSYEEKHRHQIARSLNDIERIFGKETSKKTKVDLHYLSKKDSSKGEPASGLVSTMRLPEGNADVFYWIGESTRLNDEPKEIEELERMHTTKVIHEVIHQDFQRENEIYDSVLEIANADQEILKLRKDLMYNQASYLEPELELIAIYLERYTEKILREKRGEEETVGGSPIIEYRIDEKRFQEIFVAVAREDESWKEDGPYTAVRRGWGIPDTRPSQNDQGKGVKLVIEPSIYQLGGGLDDFSLIEKYLNEKIQLDVAFIKELYILFLAQRERFEKKQLGKNSLD